MSLLNSLSDMFQGMRFFIPEILILVWVLVLTGFEIFLGKAEEKLQSNIRYFIAYLGLIFGIIFGFQRGEMNYFGPVGHNLFFLNSEYYTYSILVLGMGLILIFVNHLVKKSISFEEIISFWAIIMGALYTGASSHWLILLLGIETMTLGTYGLVAYKKSKLSYRAALPYLFFGLTVTAIFIYGISLIYGFSGSLEFLGNEFSRGLGMNPTVGIIGLSMVGMALLFKMSLAPAHPWAPEVIESLPAQWMVLLTTIPKIAIGFIGLRILKEINLPYGNVVAILCILTMTIGNLGALRQLNTKRMLAYSSIAHGGFMAMIWINPSLESYKLIFFYSIMYFIGNLISFNLLDRSQEEYKKNDISDYAGLGLEYPLYGLLVLVGILGLIGFPPAPSLWAKIGYFGFIWDYFNETNDIIYLILFTISLLFTAISLFYYLRIPYQLFLKKGDISNNHLIITGKKKILFTVLALIFLALFFFPNF